MNKRFLAYDWFKLIVLIFLIALLILLPRCISEAGPLSSQSVDQNQASTPLPQASSDATQIPESTTEAISTEASAAPPECVGALPIQLSGVGVRAEVINALIPLRGSPEVGENNILKGLSKGTVVEIISLPICTPYLSGANNWWGVRTLDGKEGYAAEGSAINPIYYLEEIP